MKHLWQKAITISMALLLVFATGCENTSQSGEGKESLQSGEGEALTYELYSTYITDKVIRNLETDEDLKLNPSFTVVAVGGEKEAAQVVVQPDKDINEVTFTISDLKTENGEIFSKEDLTMYWQGYVPCKTTSVGETGPLGDYPEYLLPYEKAVEYDENKINAGENQALIVEADVPANQPTGVYTGTFTIELDGQKVNVDASITVVINVP